MPYNFVTDNELRFEPPLGAYGQRTMIILGSMESTLDFL